MDLRNHINLIKNHNYKGGIAICKKQINGFCIAAKEGEVVLFRRYEVRDNMDSDEILYQKNHCSIEFPYSEEEIKKKRAEGNGITTYATCVGVPLEYIDEILI